MNDAAGSRKSCPWPRAALVRRIHLQARKFLTDRHDETGSWRRKLNEFYWCEGLLRWTGLYKSGHQRMIRPVAVEDEIPVPSLPQAFDGLRVLHLSDLHFDLEPKLVEVATELVSRLSFDVCLMTGDCRDRLSHGGDAGVEMAIRFLRGLGAPVYLCLGNHDLISDARRIRGGGITLLINEGTFLERKGERLYLCGVDDCGYFRTDDFDAAFETVPNGACAIVLSHDPEGYRKAADHGAALMLSGHTHGGQLCLPGGVPLFTHSRCPRRMVAGAWSYGDLQGYTSRGLGGSRVAARLFCDGEIAVHTLRCAGMATNSEPISNATPEIIPA